MLDYKCTASTVSRPPTTNSTRCPEFGGELNYAQVDVRNTDNLDDVISDIANKHRRIDGMIAAAGVQQVTPAVEYGVEDAMDMMNINYTGVFMSATATARQMIKYKCRGSICLIASMSGMVANKGLLCPVYNSSKAAVIQLAKNLAMDPGHIITPMVLENFKEEPSLQETWEKDNMLGRLATPDEFKSAGLFC
ncbi:hypothetical protein LTS18_004332 [Coniosporium uncinatum]|uniref:Uncharacterized protein n=1 Tax=Coniosporium uncinatum TaxID=93489 RepID=A0ACC3DB88_9PEZI|nr:hypothetical protein LTS18_004332 [Coniosporium uncinatum]